MSVAPPTAMVSSSSTLWATASKEWVIPPKPKPGRKPKKDAAQAAQPPPAEPIDIPTPPSTSAAPSDTAGRRVQNRAAQRAFRERKQSQLAELQARIQQYEQGEIERNVALQQVAKRLKEENDQLREEATSLKDKLAKAEHERDVAIAAATTAAAMAQETGSKRSREDIPGDSEYSEYPHRKKTRLTTDDFTQTASVTASISFFPSPPSLASSPGSNLSDQCFSPIPEPQQQGSIFSPQIALGGVFDFQSAPSTSSRPPVYESATPLDTFDCGFCSDNNPCVCRELALQARRQQPPPPLPPIRIESFKVETLDDQLRPTPLLTPVSAVRPNILDNLPAYQPPVPLRRRSGNASVKPLFPVFLATSDSSSGRAEVSGASCSGDPSNCPACADDAFGKAFCTAVGEAVASQTPCADCPNRSGAANEGTSNSCCGIPNACGGCKPTTSDTRSQTIPTSEAWRQIKSHPNAAFADLALLADVVARRTKCTGPTVVIEPAPGAFTPERCDSPDSIPPAPASAPTLGGTADAVLLSDPHAHYKQLQRERGSTSQSPPPRLVPHEELVDCARRRVRVVHADGVRDALRMLDANFGQA